MRNVLVDDRDAIFIDRDDVRFHGHDERILVESFYEGQAFLYALVKALSTSH